MNLQGGHFKYFNPERGFSGPKTDHLLWQRENVWVMDNHRLALWCWLQHGTVPANFLHFDAHYDCAPINGSLPLEQLKSLSLDDYRLYRDQQGEALFQWDNYLSHFQHHFLSQLHNNVFFTHHVGIPGQMTNHYDVWNMLPMMDQFFGHPEPWIVNLDLDYFYSRKWKKAPLVHPDVIAEMATLLSQARSEGKIHCLTIAMSPECVGGWPEAENALELFLRHFKF